MEIFKPYGKNYVYTEDEMDRMGETLLVAEEIKKDDKLYRLVLQHLDEKSDKITSIKDLRDKANMPEGDSEKKRL